MAVRIDFSGLPNPYDFANPVNDPSLFAGRSAEMDEIRYYVDQATKVDRPIHLALIGERASGKTSTLNMIGVEARNKGCCVVRINLDEADAESYRAFYYKLFDCVLTDVCEAGGFGGLSGKTYETYRDMVDAYEVPEGKEFCPFSFPMQYAKSMAKGVMAAVSD